MSHPATIRTVGIVPVIQQALLAANPLCAAKRMKSAATEAAVPGGTVRLSHAGIVRPTQSEDAGGGSCGAQEAKPGRLGVYL